MNIYFACSITGGRDLEPVFQTIVHALLEDGHTVPTAHLAESTARAYEASVSPPEVYSRDTGWISGCDVLVAEVSTPSHGVGYEVCYALGLQKPVLCVHRAGIPVSKMLTGNPDEKLRVLAYRDDEEAIGIVRAFLSNVKQIVKFVTI
jgi:2'-deoxynucleoside 5'-phosphate N-hydrolase